MKKSFTLIEILVVIVIIGILSAFIIVSMSGVSSKASIAKGQVFANSLKNSLLINLVSEWKLDDASGTTAVDSWGSNNGTWTGPAGSYTSPSWRTASECVSGGCLAFDGTDDWVNIGQPASLDFTNAFTVSLWFKRGSALDNGLMGRHSWPAGLLRGFMVDVTAANVLRLGIGDGTSGQQLQSSISPGLNKWHLATATFGSATAKIYLDGALGNSNAASFTNDNTNLGIGVWSSASGYFTGLIDDVKVFNAAMSTSQVQENYYAGLNKLLINNGFGIVEYGQRLGELKINLTKHE
jgi:prepilin-type N-terminal cleavage/methylation domain-containing protein